MTCLGLALNQFERVHAVSFNYGQRHAIELEAARGVCAIHNVPWKLVDISFFGSMVTTALVGTDKAVGQPHPRNAALPSSFVPNRNALLLTLAHAHAQEIGAVGIMTGVCQTDYSGYPDCREAFIEKLEETLNIGYGTNIAILAPLMHLDKAQIFQTAQNAGFLTPVLELSHTCYNGASHIQANRKEWGYGCGTCPACELRAKGYKTFREAYLAGVGLLAQVPTEGGVAVPGVLRRTTEVTCTKRFTGFPFAHRQPKHDGHCSQIHGHDWAFEFEFACDIPDSNGFVVDFGKLKGLRQYLKDRFDHTLVVNAADPLLSENLVHDTSKVFVVPNCGCEGLAEFLFEQLNTTHLHEWSGDEDEAKRRGLRIVRVTVEEGSDNSATVQEGGAK